MGNPRTTKIREIQATRKDYDAYVRCFHRTEYSYEVGKKSNEYRGSFLFEPLPTFDEYCRQFNTRFVSKRKFHQYTLVYENDDGEVVAVAEILEEAKILNIDEFIVDTKFQLCGYGRMFYLEIEQKAKERGHSEINLRCNFAGSKIFWTKMGFENKGVFVKKI